MRDIGEMPFIGLTATPWACGLGRYCDDSIAAAMTSDLIKERRLSQFVAFAPSARDLSSVKIVKGDLDEVAVADVMDRFVVTGDIVDTWLKRGENRSTFCFCVNRRHAQHVAEMGVGAEYMDGQTPLGDRLATFDRFRSGETTIVCNLGVLTTGVDEHVGCIIDAKPTKSEIPIVQTIGRGLRSAQSKDHLPVLDHAGNHLGLDRVTDIRGDRLDGGKERQTSENGRKAA
jgi:DNA repair protein RadD